MVLKLSVMMMVDFVHLIFFIYQFECNQSLELLNKNFRYDLFYFKMATYTMKISTAAAQRTGKRDIVHSQFFISDLH